MPEFSARAGNELRELLERVTDDAPRVPLRLMVDENGVLHSGQSPHRHCSQNIRVTSLTLGELAGFDLCTEAASLSDMLTAVSDRAVARDAELLAEIEQVAIDTYFDQSAFDCASICELVRTGFDFLAMVIETGPLFLAAMDTTNEVAKQSLNDAVRSARERIRRAHAGSLGRADALASLRAHAGELHGVTLVDDLVTVALGSGMLLLELAFGYDDQRWARLAKGDSPDGLDFAMVLQLAYAPASIDGQAVVDVPLWVAATLKLLADGTVLSDAYDDLTPVARDTAVRLWTKDTSDEFYLFDRCVSVARALDDH